MINRKSKLIFVIFLLSSHFSNAQDSLVVSEILTPKLLMSTDLQMDKPAIPSAFSYEKLGLFCKMEYQIERKVPLMIRLGEVKSTERMEGKKAMPR